MLGLLPALLAAQNGADLVLEDAWVRALPPTQNRTAAYVTIYNRGDTAVQVSGATVELAGHCEIHTSREVGGLMRMEQLPSLTLAPGQREVLAPGGTHLMLLDLERMPKLSDTLELCLQLRGAEAVCTSAQVRKSASASNHQHHH